MTDSDFDGIEIVTGQSVSAAVLWLHGLGGDGETLRALLPYFAGSVADGVRWIAPHAPRRPLTLAGQRLLRAWFDVHDFTAAEVTDRDGFRRASDRIERLLQRERERGIPSERTILAGFSQGGGLALHVGLRHRHRLAGIAAFSAYVLDEPATAREASPDNRPTPIRLMHGTWDPLIPAARGLAAAEHLRRQSYDVKFEAHLAEHNVSPSAATAFGGWIHELLRITTPY